MKKAVQGALICVVLITVFAGCRTMEEFITSFEDAKTVRKSAPAITPEAQLTPLNGLHDQRIGVLSGSAGDLAARKYFPHAHFQVFTAAADAALAITTNKADAFIYDQLSVYMNWKKNSTTTRANLLPFQKENWAFGVRKNNQELMDKLNQFIKKFREEGGFERLAEHYLPEQKQAFKTMGVPFVF